MRRLCWPRVASLLACAPLLADAATLTVTNLDDSGAGSLRDTIAAANSGDTIVFAVTGTITLTSGTLVIDKDLIVSGPGPGNLTVQRSSASGTPDFGIFVIGHLSPDTLTVSISGLTISKGLSESHAGGIYKGVDNLTLTNCILTQNSCYLSDGQGGGIYGIGGNLTLNSCSLISNSVRQAGGGICHFAGHVTLNGCTFTDNDAGIGFGGAIYSAGPELTVNGCFFNENSAQDGGGIDVVSGIVTITNSTFVANRTSSSAGAIEISAYAGTVTVAIEASTFSNNGTDNGIGGAIYVATYTNINALVAGTILATITNSTFDGNDAEHGGAVSNFAGNSTYASPLSSLELINCTFVGNTASRGGAIYNITNDAGATASVTLKACTLSNNGQPVGFGTAGSISNDASSSGSANIYLANTILKKRVGTGGVNLVNTAGTVTSQGYNLADDGGSGFLTGPGDQLNLDPKLDPAGLLNNGGPTQTIALIAGSPAIDRGNSFGLSTDQRGAVRPVDNPGVPNAADGADVGAYESPADPLQDGSSSYVVRTAADHDDGLCSVNDCTLREAIVRCNTVPGPNVITFTPALTGTITLQPAAGGQLNITDGVTIMGPGARFLKISANTQTRVLSVSGSGGSTISGLTIADGRLDNFNAGDSEGGGIYNQTTLALIDCTLDFNRAFAGSGFMTGQNGGSARGGGVFNAGALTLNRCTFKGNGAGGGSGAAHPPPPITVGGSGGDGRGGAIYNDSGASVSIANCTFSSNFVYGGNGGSGTFGGNGGNGLGSAIFNLGTLNADASTFSLNNGDPGLGGLGSNPGNNGAPGGGVGALSHGSGASTLRACIVAENTASAVVRDAYGDFISGGFNLIGRIDGSTGFSAATDQSGTNAAPLSPQLGVLANNGGQTDTMSPLPVSPVVDKGNRFGLTTDQRGVARPVDIPGIPNANGGDGSDIGSVELTQIFVTTVDDHDDGNCTVGDCTLREAINTANALSGDDTIAFAAGVTGTVQLNGALPQLSTNMVIAGPGPNLVTVRRNGGGIYRIFSVTNAPSTGPNVTLSGLTISNGLAPAGGVPIDSGGGILNDRSTLTVRDCVVTGNASNGGSFSYGGGIMNSEGTLTVDRSTLSGNNGYYGGGIANRRNTVAGVGTVTITNSTFVANTAAYGNGVYNEGQNSGRVASVSATHCTFSGNVGTGNLGAGIYNSGATSGTANLTVSHCTFAGNAADQGSSVYNFNFNGAATATLRNSILATNSATNLVNSGGSMTSLGYNLSNDAGAGVLNDATDITNTPPLLAALANNGGLTQTHALLSGSPALDKGRSFFLPLDQRGLPRVADSNVFPNAAGGDGADIGALEVSPFSGIIDSDGDGMPDEFEVFFDVDDPNGDPDGDGDNNLTEYRNRTNPRDNSSYLLRIIAIVRNGNDIVITFNGVAGRTFRLDRKEPITETSWTDTGIQVTPGTTGNAQIAHAGGASPGRGFYRVRLVP